LGFIPLAGFLQVISGKQRKPGPGADKKTVMKPNISLCAIVKDQAALLTRLLEHHRDLYTEAVIVDTGSQDDSPQVARQCGAVVSNFPWRDDFSAARNHGLDLATGDWILVLDCDELVAPEDFPALKKLARSGESIGYVMPQLNYFRTPRGLDWQAVEPRFAPYAADASGYIKAWTTRLFPNRNDLRFYGNVHETLEDSLISCGIPVKKTDIPIHHQGHLGSAEGESRRTRYYGRLLIDKLKGNPRDPRARYETAVHLAVMGKTRLAARLLESLLVDFPEWGDRHRARLLMGELRLQDGQPHEAAAQFQAALHARPDWPTCWQAVIVGSLGIGDRPAASRYLDQARRLFPLDPAWDRYETQVSGTCGR